MGISGGIDSMVLLCLLLKYNEKYRQRWDIKAAHINPGFPGWDPNILEKYLSTLNVKLVIASSKIDQRLEKVEDKCYFCSRERRKRLMEVAENLDIFNIALAHHKEDVVETLLLNMLYTGRMGTLLPRQPIVRGRFAFVRPLYHMDKKTIVAIANAFGLKIFGNLCPYYKESRRERIRESLDEIETKNPDIYTNIFNSIFNINKPYMPS